MNNKTKRQQAREKNKRQKLISSLTWGGIGMAILAFLVFMARQGVKPAAGEAIPMMVSEPHIGLDTDPGQYNSDPPTSGLHYATEAQAGFYDENIYTYPAG